MTSSLSSPKFASTVYVFLDAIDRHHRGKTELDPVWVVQSLTRLGVPARITTDQRLELLLGPDVCVALMEDETRTPPAYVPVVDLAYALYRYCFGEPLKPLGSPSVSSAMRYCMREFEARLTE